jgi:hypothetical protein
VPGEIQPTDNPFTRVYTALWDLAMRSRELDAAIKTGNRIRFDALDAVNPLKRTIASADTPELALLVRQLTANVNNTSSTSMCTRQYAWLMSTNDYRYSQFLAHIEWKLFCAMASWRTTLTSLKWQDKGFVKRVQLLGGASALSDPAANRNIVGWSALWMCEVEMNFDQTDIEKEMT